MMNDCKSYDDTGRNPDAEFQQYRRTNISEMRPYVENEDLSGVSISAQDLDAGSPKAGDMIARNPKNHDDKWLVAAQYFADNLEPVNAPHVTNSDDAVLQLVIPWVVHMNINSVSAPNDIYGQKADASVLLQFVRALEHTNGVSLLVIPAPR